MPADAEDTLAPIPDASLQTKVAEALARAIVSGRLRNGQRLNEVQLARQFQVSRAPVREALRQLAAEGLVEIVPRRGAFVARLERQDLWEIYTLRQALESLAVEILVSRRGGVDLSPLRAILDAMDAAVQRRQLARLVELDMTFHEELCRLSGHGRLHDAWRRMGVQLRSFFAAVRPLYEDWQMVSRHRELLEAVEAGELERALAVLREHIAGAAARVLSRLEAGRSEGAP